MKDDLPEASGWQAIDAALSPLYGDQQPRHWGPILHARIGGPDPLDGISAYRVEKPAHWHYLTYGMSELYEKETDDPEVSGWGFEFTLRLVRQGEADEAEPPAWVLNFLNNLARYVLETGNVFDVGHHMDLNGPIALAEDTAIRALAFAADPELGSIATPHGRLKFLQVVGLTLDELHAVEAWDTEKFLGLIQRSDPLLLTDLRRASRLLDPSLAGEVQQGSARDGSSQATLFASKVEWSVGAAAQVTLGANAVAQLLRLLPQRLPFGREFALAGSRQLVRFEPAPSPLWRAEEEALVIGLPGAACRQFCDGLAARRGKYGWAMLPGLNLVVVPSEIKDHEGRVIEIVG